MKPLIWRTVASRLAWNSAQLFLLRIAGMGLLFLMHAALARRLGASDYGIVSYALSLAGFGALVATLGLPNGVMRFAAQYLDAERWEELRGLLVRTFQIALVSAVSGALMIAAASALPAASIDLRRSLLYAALILPLVALGLWRTMAARGLGEILAAYGPEEVLLPGLVIAALYALSIDRPGPAIVVHATVAFVVLILGLVWLVRRVPQPVRGAQTTTHTRLWLSISIPMTVASVTQLSLNRADVLLIGVFADMGETGRYIAASRLAILISLALRIVDTAVAPMISAAFHGGRRNELRTLFLVGTGLSFLGGLPFFVVAMAAPGFLLRIFGGEYLEAAPVLRVLVFGQMINAATGPIGFLLLMTGRERLFAKAIAITAVLAIAAHWVVIPQWGGLGAAWVTAVSIGMLNASLLVYGIRKVLR